VPKRVIVELSPTRTEVALLKGSRVSAGASVRHEAGHDLAGLLSAAGQHLPGLVERCGAQGAEATIIYHSPTAVCAVHACPKAAGAAGAERAARLALSETAEFPLAANPHDLRPLCADRGDEAAGVPQAHALAVAEVDETARAVAAAASAAGLRPGALVPAAAVAIAAACRRAMGAGAGSAAVVLHVGEQASVLAGCAQGRLRFTREVGIGSEAFVDALAREIRPTDPQATPVVLSREAARKLVMSVGVPLRAQEVDAALGLKGESVLPLMQPVVQRFLVEIRQSLRFGLEEAQRGSAVLIGSGGGVRVPRMIGLIGEQCGLAVTEGGATGAGPDESSACGLISEYLAEGAAGIRLLPRQLGRQTSLRATQRALWTGIAAAGVLVAGDAILTRRDLRATRAEIALLEKGVSEASAAGAVRDRYMSEQAALAGARVRMAGRMAAVADWDAVLSALSASTPAVIRISEIDMRMENGRATMRLSGATPLNGGQDNAIKGYLDAVSAIPVVRSCRLGATQRSESPAGPVQAFDMTVSLVEVPPGVRGGAGGPAQASVTQEVQP
jgi:hypothetical protein